MEILKKMIRRKCRNKKYCNKNVFDELIIRLVMTKEKSL